MDLKRLVEISPAIGSFLIFIGFTKLFLYFHYWDINIINYLDFSEIILSFLNDLNVLIFFVVLMVIQMTIGIGTIYIIDRLIKYFKRKKKAQIQIKVKKSESVELTVEIPNSNITEDKGLLPVIEEKMDESIETGFIVTGIMTIALFCFFFYNANMKILYITYIVFIQFLILVFTHIIKTKNINLISQLIIGILLVTFSLSLTFYDIKQTEQKSLKVGILLNSDEKIVSGTNLLFLGKTNNYYFFFDESKQMSFIYPSNSVQKVIQSN